MPRMLRLALAVSLAGASLLAPPAHAGGTVVTTELRAWYSVPLSEDPQWHWVDFSTGLPAAVDYFCSTSDGTYYRLTAAWASYSASGRSTAPESTKGGTGLIDWAYLYADGPVRETVPGTSDAMHQNGSVSGYGDGSYRRTATTLDLDLRFAEVWLDPDSWTGPASPVRCPPFRLRQSLVATGPRLGFREGEVRWDIPSFAGSGPMLDWGLR